MAPPTAASPIRVAIIDDDSGLVTVLDRRFARLRWEREVIGYAATPDQLSAMRIHAVILNPAITGLDYLERIALALPGLALLVCAQGRRPSPTECVAYGAGPTTGSPSPATPRS